MPLFMCNRLQGLQHSFITRPCRLAVYLSIWKARKSSTRPGRVQGCVPGRVLGRVPGRVEPNCSLNDLQLLPKRPYTLRDSISKQGQNAPSLLGDSEHRRLPWNWDGGDLAEVTSDSRRPVSTSRSS